MAQSPGFTVSAFLSLLQNMCVVKLFVLCGTTFNVRKCTSTCKFTKLQLLTTTKQHGYADKNYIDLLITTFSTAGGGGPEKVL